MSVLYVYQAMPFQQLFDIQNNVMIVC